MNDIFPPFTFYIWKFVNLRFNQGIIINYTNYRFNENHILCKKKKVKLRAEIVAADSDAPIKAEATLSCGGFYINVYISLPKQ